MNRIKLHNFGLYLLKVLKNFHKLCRPILLKDPESKIALTESCSHERESVEKKDTAASLELLERISKHKIPLPEGTTSLDLINESRRLEH